MSPPMPPSSPQVIIIAPDGDCWRVLLEGEALTVHATEQDAKRSASQLAERLRARAGGRVQLKVVGSDQA